MVTHGVVTPVNKCEWGDDHVCRKETVWTCQEKGPSNSQLKPIEAICIDFAVIMVSFVVDIDLQKGLVQPRSEVLRTIGAVTYHIINSSICICEIYQLSTKETPKTPRKYGRKSADRAEVCIQCKIWTNFCQDTRRHFIRRSITRGVRYVVPPRWLE